MMVVNASHAATDCAHILPQLSRFDCTLQDARDDVALLAFQGPLAERVLAWPVA
jgi:glycine cleavage system aminomethyltransferase T